MLQVLAWGDGTSRWWVIVESAGCRLGSGRSLGWVPAAGGELLLLVDVGVRRAREADFLVF
ncbi:hypothetical protein [Rhodococcus sp. IEGM 1379]|uniref:hypothetical protein n=1 Tax=Rhodococcus sp. IEGM 1379 TaxID=3047086 RepID=UPI0024B7C42D|nr:hypothetical protein [Rhodococcus sp. IEGM 1379]